MQRVGGVAAGDRDEIGRGALEDARGGGGQVAGDRLAVRRRASRWPRARRARPRARPPRARDRRGPARRRCTSRRRPRPRGRRSGRGSRGGGCRPPRGSARPGGSGDRGRRRSRALRLSARPSPAEPAAAACRAPRARPRAPASPGRRRSRRRRPRRRPRWRSSSVREPSQRRRAPSSSGARDHRRACPRAARPRPTWRRGSAGSRPIGGFVNGNGVDQETAVPDDAALSREGGAHERAGRRAARARAARPSSAPTGPRKVESIFLKTRPPGEPLAPSWRGRRPQSPRRPPGRAGRGSRCLSRSRACTRDRIGGGRAGAAKTPTGPAAREEAARVAGAGQVVGDDRDHLGCRCRHEWQPYHRTAGSRDRARRAGRPRRRCILRVKARVVVALLALAAVLAPGGGRGRDPVAALSLIRPKPAKDGQHFEVAHAGGSRHPPRRSQGQGGLPELLGDLVRPVQGGDAAHGAPAPGATRTGAGGAGDLPRLAGRRGAWWARSSRSSGSRSRRARSQDGGARAATGCWAVPSTFLIDRKGKRVLFANGAREWDGKAAHAVYSSRC